MNNRPFLILVAGASASGKTTVVDNIISKAKIDEVVRITMDDYYLSFDDVLLEDKKRLNYDHPNAVDLDLLYEHISLLLLGGEINKPIYNYISYKRDENTELIKPAKVIIVEGIFALYDIKIGDLADLKIYVDSDPDIRLIRRLKRDIKERNRTFDSVVEQYLETVKPMYHEFVSPTKRNADIIIPNDKRHDTAVEVISGKIDNIFHNK